MLSSAVHFFPSSYFVLKAHWLLLIEPIFPQSDSFTSLIGFLQKSPRELQKNGRHTCVMILLCSSFIFNFIDIHFIYIIKHNPNSFHISKCLVLHSDQLYKGLDILSTDRCGLAKVRWCAVGSIHTTMEGPCRYSSPRMRISRSGLQSSWGSNAP